VRNQHQMLQLLCTLAVLSCCSCVDEVGVRFESCI
jgi:hypothetical protein